MAVPLTRRQCLIVAAVTIASIIRGPADASRAEAPQIRSPTVFAAASLKSALDAINAQWQADIGKRATISYAGSSVLAKQIEQGAPADIFISADSDWMNYLAKRDLIDPETRLDLLRNRLVLIAGKSSGLAVKIEPGFPLSRLLGDGYLAMANTDAVPAGKYGKAALHTLGVWNDVKDKIVQADNVRAALLLVSRGEAPLGIVYQTDAAADPAVEVLDRFPAETHPPIIYPVAVLTQRRALDAAAFIAYLRSPAAKTLFENQGFIVLQ